MLDTLYLLPSWVLALAWLLIASSHVAYLLNLVFGCFLMFSKGLKVGAGLLSATRKRDYSLLLLGSVRTWQFLCHELMEMYSGVTGTHLSSFTEMKKVKCMFWQLFIFHLSRKDYDTAKRWGVWPKKTFLIFESTSTGSVSRSSSHTSFKELFFLFCLGRRLSTLQSWSFFVRNFGSNMAGGFFQCALGLLFYFSAFFVLLSCCRN